MQWNEQSLLLMLKDVSVGDGIDAWPSLSGESHASSMLGTNRQSGDAQSEECWIRARERDGFEGFVLRGSNRLLRGNQR